MDNKNYPSDLTNEQWKLIEPLLPPAKTGGRLRSTDLRQVINGILYLVRTGCSWRMLPRDFLKMVAARADVAALPAYAQQPKKKKAGKSPAQNGSATLAGF